MSDPLPFNSDDADDTTDEKKDISKNPKSESQNSGADTQTSDSQQSDPKSSSSSVKEPEVETEEAKALREERERREAFEQLLAATVFPNLTLGKNLKESLQNKVQENIMNFDELRKKRELAVHQKGGNSSLASKIFGKKDNSDAEYKQAKALYMASASQEMQGRINSIPAQIYRFKQLEERVNQISDSPIFKAFTEEMKKSSPEAKITDVINGFPEEHRKPMAEAVQEYKQYCSELSKTNHNLSNDISLIDKAGLLSVEDKKNALSILNKHLDDANHIMDREDTQEISKKDGKFKEQMKELEESIKQFIDKLTSGLSAIIGKRPSSSSPSI